MTCPICNIALKLAQHRGVDVNYCPLCGGTWLDRYRFDHLPTPTTAAPRPHRRMLRIAILTALVLAVCLVAVVSVAAVKLWPTVRSWTEALLSEKETALTSQVRQLAGRLGDQRVMDLSRSGLDSVALSALVGNPGFERLLNSIAAVPSLGLLVQNGAYLKVLQEATRQNVRNLADLNPDKIVSPEIRAATAQVQQALRMSPNAEAAAGIVDPVVLEVLGSDVFQQLSRSGLLERLFKGAKGGAQVD